MGGTRDMNQPQVFVVGFQKAQLATHVRDPFLPRRLRSPAVGYFAGAGRGARGSEPPAGVESTDRGDPGSLAEGLGLGYEPRAFLWRFLNGKLRGL